MVSPIGGSYLREKMQAVIEAEGLPDVVFHSLRHTSITYKLKLSGGDIKSVQGDSGHSQADMITEVYGHIIDEDRRKNAQLIEAAFYNKENLSPNMYDQGTENSANANTITITEGIDADLLLKNLYWAGRKTRVHQMAGKTPAVFVMRKNKLVSIFDKHRI